MHKLKEKLMRELDELAQKEDLGAWELDTIEKTVGIVKDLCEIMEMDDGGYSQNRGMHRGGERSYRAEPYGDENSYAGQRRDNRGRYSRDDGREGMMNELESMMGRMGSEKDRETLRRMMDTMRGA